MTAEQIQATLFDAFLAEVDATILYYLSNRESRALPGGLDRLLDRAEAEARQNPSPAARRLWRSR